MSSSSYPHILAKYSVCKSNKNTKTVIDSYQTTCSDSLNL